MSDRPDEAALQELGENTTNAANAWAGAQDYHVRVARGEPKHRAILAVVEAVLSARG